MQICLIQTYSLWFYSLFFFVVCPHLTWIFSFPFHVLDGSTMHSLLCAHTCSTHHNSIWIDGFPFIYIKNKYKSKCEWWYQTLKSSQFVQYEFAWLGVGITTSNLIFIIYQRDSRLAKKTKKKKKQLATAFERTAMRTLTAKGKKRKRRHHRRAMYDDGMGNLRCDVGLLVVDGRIWIFLFMVRQGTIIIHACTSLDVIVTPVNTPRDKHSYLCQTTIERIAISSATLHRFGLNSST